MDITISHASGEEAVGAIFDRLEGKVRQDEGADEGTSNRSAKRKNKKQWCVDSLVAVVDRKGGRKPTEGTPNHFEKLLEGPCLPGQAFVQGLRPHEAVLVQKLQQTGTWEGP